MTQSERLWADWRGRINLSALADELGLTRAAVSAWRQVPPVHARRVAAWLGTDPASLRPDIFPASTAAPDPWSAL